MLESLKSKDRNLFFTREDDAKCIDRRVNIIKKMERSLNPGCSYHYTEIVCTHINIYI